VLTIACAVVALALGGVLTLSGYIVGRARKLRDGEGYLAGRAEGMRLGRSEGLRERDDLTERLDEATAEYIAMLSQLAEVKSTLDATMLRFEEYVEDHANTYPPTIWSDAVPPGGQVCAAPVDDQPGEICGMPVESEPCPAHVCACYRTVDAIYEDAREVNA
jgi:hypothetical protein